MPSIVTSNTLLFRSHETNAKDSKDVSSSRVLINKVDRSYDGAPNDILDEKSKTEKKLKRHKEAKHEKITYPCDQCDHVAKSKSQLKVHTDNKHLGKCLWMRAYYLDRIRDSYKKKNQ